MGTALQRVHGRIQGVVRVNEEKLETVKKLLRLRLITRGMSLTALIVYYKLCNALLRIALEILQF